jgi:hypothetical protein
MLLKAFFTPWGQCIAHVMQLLNFEARATRANVVIARVKPNRGPSHSGGPPKGSSRLQQSALIFRNGRVFGPIGPLGLDVHRAIKSCQHVAELMVQCPAVAAWEESMTRSSQLTPRLKMPNPLVGDQLGDVLEVGENYSAYVGKTEDHGVPHQVLSFPTASICFC